ncbi:hypothetical protein CKA32_001464 [Geitlerinema sp. FC II]|nr:hypothetical protein CKA32_001464 [Geitlerinema sp. FC II]
MVVAYGRESPDISFYPKSCVVYRFSGGASHFRKYTNSAICQYFTQGLLEGDLLL